MHFSIGNADKHGDVAVQIQQCVHLDGGFVFAESRPGEKGQAQVDGGRVQRIQTLIQIHADRIGGIQRSRDADQYLLLKPAAGADGAWRRADDAALHPQRGGRQ
jgi:hypothetical protein